MAEIYLFPFGVYDIHKCCLQHIGLYKDEAETWKIYLGWPDESEITYAKGRGLRVLPLTVQYDPPK